MIEITITTPDAPPASANLENGAYIIGASSSCHIPLKVTGISRRHAQLIVADGRITIMDLGSSNGTKVNGGEAIFPNTPIDISAGANLSIGKAVIRIKPQYAARPQTVQPVNKETLSEADQAARRSIPKAYSVTPEKEDIPVLQTSAFPLELRPAIQEIKRQAHRELLVRMNLKKMALSGVSNEELAQKAKAMIQEILSQFAAEGLRCHGQHRRHDCGHSLLPDRGIRGADLLRVHYGGDRFLRHG